MKTGRKTDQSAEGMSKPWSQRALRNTSVSRRKAAGGKRNKKHKFVGSFGSDRA